MNLHGTVGTLVDSVLTLHALQDTALERELRHAWREQDWVTCIQFLCQAVLSSSLFCWGTEAVVGESKQLLVHEKTVEKIVVDDGGWQAKYHQLELSYEALQLQHSSHSIIEKVVVDDGGWQAKYQQLQLSFQDLQLQQSSHSITPLPSSQSREHIVERIVEKIVLDDGGWEAKYQQQALELLAREEEFRLLQLEQARCLLEQPKRRSTAIKSSQVDILELEARSLRNSRSNSPEQQAAAPLSKQRPKKPKSDPNERLGEIPDGWHARYLQMAKSQNDLMAINAKLSRELSGRPAVTHTST